MATRSEKRAAAFAFTVFVLSVVGSALLVLWADRPINPATPTILIDRPKVRHRPISYDAPEMYGTLPNNDGQIYPSSEGEIK